MIMNEQNRKTYDALKHYVKFEKPPNYAIFLNGPWGSGKTYFIEQFIKNELSESDSHIYISLYGLSTTREIDNAIFKKVYPKIAGKTSNIAQKLIKSGLGIFKVNIDIDLQQIINIPKSKLYIFDDFERCDIPFEQTLGYINNLVEHEKLKSIIIGNESEIANNEKYRIKKEKLIGRTYRITPEFNNAWKSFLENSPSKDAAKTLNKLKNPISLIYTASEVNNLRILQQTIWDYTRIYECLTERHKNHEKAMEALTQIVFAYAFEVKSGRLSESDLELRQEAINQGINISASEGSAGEKFWKIAQRYSPFDIQSSVISTNILLDILFNGHVSGSEISKCINQSAFFVDSAVDSWRVAPHWETISDEVFFEAFADIKKKLELLDYKIPDIIMHAFDIKLWAAKNGISSEKPTKIIAHATQYIDTLFSTNELEPLFNRAEVETHHSRYAIQFLQGETKEFKEIRTYLIEKRLDAGIQTHKKTAYEFVENFNSTPEKYLEMLTSVTPDSWPNQFIPFLSYVNIPDFIVALLAASPEIQQNLFRNFSFRFSKYSLDNGLCDENQWIVDFISTLETKIPTLSPLSKIRIQHLIDSNLKTTLQIYPQLLEKLSLCSPK